MKTRKLRRYVVGAGLMMLVAMAVARWAPKYLCLMKQCEFICSGHEPPPVAGYCPVPVCICGKSTGL